MTNPRVQLLIEAADDCIECANHYFEQAPNMGRSKDAQYRRQASDCEARARELRDWADELAPGGTHGGEPNASSGESGTAAAPSVDARTGEAGEIVMKNELRELLEKIAAGGGWGDEDSIYITSEDIEVAKAALAAVKPLAEIAEHLEQVLFIHPLQFRGGMGGYAADLRKCLQALQQPLVGVKRDPKTDRGLNHEIYDPIGRTTFTIHYGETRAHLGEREGCPECNAVEPVIK
jgi:hypothetical protein